MSPKQRLPLGEWVHSKRLFCDLFTESSKAYIISALRVACSLADQICIAEEENEADGRLLLLPPPSSNWVDSIVVEFNTYGGKNENCDSLDLDIGGGLQGGEEDDDDIKAEFLPSLFSTKDDDDTLDNGMQRIYSLGLVFYEIFSGGERPPELEQQQQQKAGNETESVSDTETKGPVSREPPGGVLDDPLPFDQVDIGELNTLDDLQDQYNDLWGTNDIDEFLQGQQPKKKQSRTNNDVFSVSVEPLKANGIPGSLCDLIANMVDITNCALGGKGAYLNMSDVRDDLHLMLEKPTIYLYDQDMGMLSTTGLQFRDTVFGRSAELSTLKECYRQSVSANTNTAEVAIITGASGSGKSFLAHEFGKHVIAGGGIFLSGKFDQLQQGKPFTALASAFNDYCGVLSQNKPSSAAVASKLRSTLGSDVYYLTKMIPNLESILGLGNKPGEDRCINAQKRLEYLLCQFVDVIAASLAAPVTLFLDDLQWADTASIAAVNQLLLNGGPTCQDTKFFFLGCYREGESSCIPFWRAMYKSNLLNGRSTTIKLDCMDERTLNTMVSETLCLSPRLTRALSNLIHHKTKGNPLFVSRLMLSLSKEGLLRPSLSRRRWEWDEEKIQYQKLPDDVAMFLTHSMIGVLSDDVKSILCLMSCFGASVDSAFVTILERALNRNVLDGLDTAVAEGLLDKIDDQYRFSHDRVQEAAYNMMNVLNRCHFHFQYGNALAPLATGEKDDGILLAAVNQFNLAGPEAVQDESQNAIVADLNLRAGKKAMEMSDFSAAYNYFDNGISFLRKNHWHEHYVLTLDLFDSATKCAFTNGDVISLQLLAKQVLKKAHFFEDKLNAIYFSTCALTHTAQFPQSIEKGLEVLSKLGIELRGCGSSMEEVEACVKETKELLLACTDDEILNTKCMTDPTMIMTMKFLGRLEFTTMLTMPRTVPFVTQQIIQLSLSKGMSPVSPIGFAYFGAYIAKLGDISYGYHCVKLALSLVDKVGSKESAGEILAVCAQVAPFVEPLQSASEYHMKGYAASMTTGDVSSAMVNSIQLESTNFYAGVNLQIVSGRIEKSIMLFKEQNHAVFTVQLQQMQRTVYGLIGSDEEPEHLSEEQNILASNKSVMRTYWYQKSFACFMFGCYDETRDYTEKFFACSEDTWSNLMFLHSASVFYAGLISFWLARKSGEQRWRQRGNQSKLAVKRWTESSQWTFENKLYLLEAEESFCNNDIQAAKTSYEKAISSAKEHKFVNEEALACELAAYFYLELGETETSIEHFLLAHEKYHEWGAFGKSTSLFEFVQRRFTLTPSLNVPSNSNINGRVDGSNNGGSNFGKRSRQ